MNKLFLFLIIPLFLSSCLAIQKGEDGNPGIPEKNTDEITTQKSKFDQKLADSLGADQYGMKSYTMVILKTGKNDATITDKNRRAELFKGHFSNMEKMQNEGKLIVAGPFGDNHLQYRGLFILDVKTAEEAKQLVEQDPTIKAGIFEYEILPYYGSAALPLYLPYHEKVAKENP